MNIRTSVANQRGPVFPYWIAMSCFLAPEKMRAFGVNEIGTGHAPFVYVAELHASATDWSREAVENLIVTLPPEVERAVAERRAVVLVSLAHEGHSVLGGDDSGEVTGNPEATSEGPSLFDRVADVASAYDLLPEQLWLVTGHAGAGADAAAWMAARGISGLPFTLRSCEIATFGMGLAMRESLTRGRGPVHLPVHHPDGGAQAGWAQSRFAWVDRPFPGFPPCGSFNWPEPRFRYACLNRVMRAQRWWVLERLWREGLLGLGLVTFPVPTALELGYVGCDPIPSHMLPLLDMLPLALEDEWAASTQSRGFVFQNSYAVTTVPEAIVRACVMQIVTETWYMSTPFVTEKSLKALLGRGPAILVGPAGNLAYLHSLGAQTWGDFIDESYDEVVGNHETTGSLPHDVHVEASPRAVLSDSQKAHVARFNRCMDTAVALCRDPAELMRLERASLERRAQNIRWLTQARKPWDDLLDELKVLLAA